MVNLEKTDLTIAVAGNPNAGKTTIFNNLTGANQHVGNYPGVTVELSEGTLTRGDLKLKVIDLPGTYSLTAFSEEELVARDFLVKNRPDVVVNVVDASNLERNLFLTTELMEIGRPLILVLNMVDVARNRNQSIDIHGLSERLGVPIVQAVGHKGLGMDELIEAIAQVLVQHEALPASSSICKVRATDLPMDAICVKFPQKTEELIETITEMLPAGEHRRWQAIKLVERDAKVMEIITDPEIRVAIEALVADFESRLDQDTDVEMARSRYDFINEICSNTCSGVSELVETRSDRLDRIVMHPVWGVPLFLVLMFMAFNLTFSLGNPMMDQLDAGFGWLSSALDGLWPEGSPSPLRSLLVEGILGGVGGVFVFLPNIVLLFMAIAILEGTGYMARAAFVMDRLMSKVGLQGKSFIPLLIGFGCTVPAIMATRTLETRRDRLITMMVLPLMSCGARLPIYALMIPAFFAPKYQGPVLWLIYVTGIMLALIGAKILRTTVFRGENTPFVMELPPYRMPTGKSLLVQMWTRAWLYMKKAGTVILGVSILLWVLTYYPKPPADYIPPQDFDLAPGIEVVAGSLVEESVVVPYGEMTDENARQAAELSYSIAGRVGRLLEPVINPIGFDWRIGTALVGAVAAKEVFVAQMGVVFAVGEADETSSDLRTRLRRRYSPLVGFCIMLFALIATPCVATFAITRQESGSLMWAFAQAWGLTALAWILTFAVYQGGLLLGWGRVAGVVAGSAASVVVGAPVSTGGM